MTDRWIPPPGSITQAEADRRHAAAAARGTDVCIEASVIPDPSPIRRFITGLFPALTRQSPEAEAEIEP